MKITLGLIPFVVVLSSGIVSCSSIGLKQTLEPQVSEVQGMREELDAKRSALQARLDSIERDVEAFGSHDVDLTTVNPAAYRKVVLGATDEEIIEASAELSDGEEVAAAVGALDDRTRAELDSMGAERERLMNALDSELPAELAALTESAAKTAVKTASIKAESDQLAKVGAKNPLMFDDDLKALEANQARLQAEIANLTTLGDKIMKEASQYSARVSAAATNLQLQLDLTGK